MPSLSKKALAGGTGGDNAAVAGDFLVAAQAQLPQQNVYNNNQDNNFDSAQTIRSVSPHAGPTSSPIIKQEEGTNGGNIASRRNTATAAPNNNVSNELSKRQPDLPRSKSDSTEGKSIDKDITLSLNDANYKKCITKYFEMLYGENRNKSLRACDLKLRVYDDLDAQVQSSGGKLYRGSRGGESHVAGYQEALEKISNDLSRAKSEWSGSVVKNTESKKGGQVTAKERKKGGNGHTAIQGGPIILPPSTNPEDLVVTKTDSKYNKIINKCAERKQTGENKQAYRELALHELIKIPMGGGKLYKKDGMNYFQVEQDDALKKMVKDIRKGVVKARKGHDKIIILSLENEKYKTAFDNIVSSEKDKISESRSRELGGSLLERLRSGGAKYFFKQAGDEQKLSRDEILSHIIKDITSQDTFTSSTRKKRSINEPNRPLLGQRIGEILEEQYGWQVQSPSSDSLNNDYIATKGTCTLTGHDEMINYAFLNGIYEEMFVKGGSEDGQKWLEKARINLENPYSIFNEELKQERKRRKINDGHTLSGDNDTQQSTDINSTISSTTQRDRSAGNVASAASSAATSRHEAETTADHPPSLAVPTPQPDESAVASLESYVARKDHVRRMFKEVKAKLANCSATPNISALQKQFYAHIKTWLARNVKTVQESKLKSMQEIMDGFDECVNDLESASDEEETKFYTDSCHDDIEHCKKELPL